MEVRNPIDISIDSLSRMQARAFLPQEIYRWEQIEFAGAGVVIFKSGRRGNTNSSRGELPEAALIG